MSVLSGSFLHFLSEMTLFDYMHLKLIRKAIPSLFAFYVLFAGVVIGQYQCLPLSFDVVLAVMPLFYIGSVF